jgi:hypothetical protein
VFDAAKVKGSRYQPPAKMCELKVLCTAPLSSPGGLGDYTAKKYEINAQKLSEIHK